MTLAITAAAHTTVPVTWTSPAGHTVTVPMPTQLHAAYADATHTATVVQLADPAQTVVPATAVQSASTGGAIGLGGATLIGLGLVIWFAARWKAQAKEVKRAFLLGVVATVLVGSWGIFGTLTGTVRTTGDSVGNSVGNTISQQSSVSR